MIQTAQTKYPDITFILADAQRFKIDKTFDGEKWIADYRRIRIVAIKK